VLVWLVAAEVFLLVVAFDPLGYQAFDLPKSLLGHVFAAVMVVSIAACLTEFGPDVLPRTRLHFAVVAFCLACAVSTAFAESTYVALWGERARYLGLVHVLDMAVLYFAVAIAFRTSRDWAALFWSVALAALVTIGYAALQRAGLDPVGWLDDPSTRPFGTFGNPDQFGSFLAGAFGLGLAAAAFAPGRLIRLGGIAMAALCSAALAIVATRAAFVGVLAALPVLGIVYLRLRGLAAGSIVRVALAALAVCGVVAIVMVATPLGARAFATFQGAGLADRPLLYRSAVNAAAERPVLGWGPDSFSVAYPRHRDPASARLTGTPVSESSAHSWPLEIAVTTGAVGTAALVTLIALVTLLLWRSGLAREPAVAAAALVAVGAYLAQGLGTVTSIGSAWIPWAGAGAAAAAGAVTSDPAHRARAGPIPAFVAAAVGAAALLAALGALDASHLALATVGAQARDDSSRAIAAARAAVERDPGRSQYWNLLGLAYDTAERWRESGDAYAEAARRGSYEAVFWMNLARSRARQSLAGDATSGGPDASLDAARRAVAIDPNNWDVHGVLGEVANAFGRYEESLRAMATALELGRREPTDDTVVASASAKLPDAALVRPLLLRMVSAKETAPLRVALAKVDLRLNDVAAARTNLTRALQLDPANVEARRLLDGLGR
jgi:O-antigen ligase